MNRLEVLESISRALTSDFFGSNTLVYPHPDGERVVVMNEDGTQFVIDAKVWRDPREVTKETVTEV